jgi:metal transporter CNNM
MPYIISGLLVLLSGLFSGLTIGLMSLNKTELQRKMKLGDVDAKKVYSVRKNGNFLLSTLLLGNVAVNTALSIFLGDIASGFIGGIIATALIVILGEIIPQALFSRYALRVGGALVFVVKFFMIVLAPVSYPIAWILDKALGKEIPTVWSREEIKEIVRFHQLSKSSDIDKDEERIVLGALSFSERRVKDIYTPKDEIFALEKDVILDQKVLKKIRESGYTRIPVFEKDLNVIYGILFVKDVIGKKKKRPIHEYARTGNVLFVYEHKKLDSLLNQFIQQKIHLAIVLNNEKKVVGIVSLEDVVEEILEREILDEVD